MLPSVQGFRTRLCSTRLLRHCGHLSSDNLGLRRAGCCSGAGVLRRLQRAQCCLPLRRRRRPAGGRQPLQMLTITTLAKQGGHGSCGVKRGTVFVFDCDGAFRLSSCPPVLGSAAKAYAGADSLESLGLLQWLCRTWASSRRKCRVRPQVDMMGLAPSRGRHCSQPPSSGLLALSTRCGQSCDEDGFNKNENERPGR
jgi:hypothetical protein